MNSNVLDLSHNLVEKIRALGIASTFVENPAFFNIIEDIKALIIQMNMGEEMASVAVIQEEGKIFFSWNSLYEGHYELEISSRSPDSFSCICVHDKKPWSGNDGRRIMEKEVREIAASIDSHQFIKVQINDASINDINCDIDEFNLLTTAEKQYYTNEGLMSEREYKRFKPTVLNEKYNFLTPNVLLSWPRQGFGSFQTKVPDSYVARSLLTRDEFDTARLIAENKENGFCFSGIVPLNSEYGLSRLNISGNVYQDEVYIPSLNDNEIEDLICSEPNLKVQEVLRREAERRKNYSYYSGDDPNFIFIDKSMQEKEGKRL